VNPDVTTALEVTVVGMALVFLTLFICALVIIVLRRAFKPKPEEEGAQQEPLSILPASAQTSAVPQFSAQASDEAVAIAVAIALAQRARVPHVETSLRPGQASRGVARSAEEAKPIPGEAVTVIAIDPGTSTWGGVGRIQATR
jgi:Na+-transporting methylmalonyl-CoA/oxaloacetate decarboxylase gamma subunit